MLVVILSAAGCGGGAPATCSEPKSQGPSLPCCTSYGVDACGADLFCAAFDGRTRATCYPEHSRLDMTSCTADIQCASRKCNLTAGACASSPHSSCTAAIGCAPDPTGDAYYCVDGTCTLPTGNGSCADVCGTHADCVQSNACDMTLHRCLCTGGEANCDKSGCVAGSTCTQAGCPGGVGDGWCCR